MDFKRFRAVDKKRRETQQKKNRAYNAAWRLLNFDKTTLAKLDARYPVEGHKEAQKPAKEEYQYDMCPDPVKAAKNFKKGGTLFAEKSQEVREEYKKLRPRWGVDSTYTGKRLLDEIHNILLADFGRVQVEVEGGKRDGLSLE